MLKQDNIFIFNVVYNESDDCYSMYYKKDDNKILKSTGNMISKCGLNIVKDLKSDSPFNTVDTISFDKIDKYLFVVVSKTENNLYRSCVLSNINEEDALFVTDENMLQSLYKLFFVIDELV